VSAVGQRRDGLRHHLCFVYVREIQTQAIAVYCKLRQASRGIVWTQLNGRTQLVPDRKVDYMYQKPTALNGRRDFDEISTRFRRWRALAAGFAGGLKHVWFNP
jgi:hypothetical protein